MPWAYLAARVIDIDRRICAKRPIRQGIVCARVARENAGWPQGGRTGSDGFARNRAPLHHADRQHRIGDGARHLVVRTSGKIAHRSVAMQPVQDRRDQKQIPGGLKLHQYANLYFHARNPMLFKRLPQVAGLCVLRVSVDVLALPGAVITDCNAASDYVRFLAPAQWRFINFDDVYAHSWTHPATTGRGTFSIAPESALKCLCLTRSTRSTLKVLTSQTRL